MNQAFVASHRKQLQQLLRCYKTQLEEQIIPFWETRVQDTVHQGYFNGFDEKGNLNDTTKDGWFIGRDMYMFSYLYRTYKQEPRYREIAQAGRAFMEKASLDEHRFAKKLTQQGQVLEGATSIFTDHFIVKGLYQYIEAFGCEDKELAQRLTDALFEHVQTPEVLEKEGIPAHLQKHAICFMTLLVAMESKALFGNTYQPILEECLHRSLYVFANDDLQAPFEYVGKDGKPVLQGEGRLVDPGHTMESLWFAMHTGLQEGNDAYRKRAKTVLDWVLRLGWDTVYGGFYQHVDVQKGVPETPFLCNSYDGLPVAWDDKIWWVQAEGLYTLLLSSLLNGEENHFSYFLRLHDFTQAFFMDEAVGEWNSICHRDGTVKDGRKGFALKGPYHVMRAYVQIVQLLEKALEQDAV